MHPAMAVWIWTMAMARAWQSSAFDTMQLGADDRERAPLQIATEPRLVLANPYLQSQIPETPLPDRLLDRLAELYWTERDGEMAI